MTERRAILVRPSSVKRAVVACSLGGGISSVLLINATEFASMVFGPMIAAGAAALYAGFASPRRVRSVAVAGGKALLGSVAVMFGLVSVFALIYAIFG